jgi:tetratricopeptide (TPR) repeat protein
MNHRRSITPVSEFAERASPKHQSDARSSLSLRERVRLRGKYSVENAIVSISQRQLGAATKTPEGETRPRASLLSLTLWFCLCASCFARADDVSTTFDQANKLYEEGKFTDAATAYEKMLRQGQASPALYFNLGNALFKAGQVGRAVLNYRLAEQLAPRDPDIRANLKFARNSVGAAPMQSWWQRWTSRLTLNEWTLLTAGALWLWLGLLAVGQWRPALRNSLGGYTATAGVGAALLALCLCLESYNRFAIKLVIVAAREAIVRYGPWNESPNYFTVRDGMELTVLDAKGEWVQIADRAKRIGWLRRDQVLVLPASATSGSS